MKYILRELAQNDNYNAIAEYVVGKEFSIASEYYNNGEFNIVYHRFANRSDYRSFLKVFPYEPNCLYFLPGAKFEPVEGNLSRLKNWIGRIKR